jgi:hypothetical protein
MNRLERPWVTDKPYPQYYTISNAIFLRKDSLAGSMPDVSD